MQNCSTEYRTDTSLCARCSGASLVTRLRKRHELLTMSRKCDQSEKLEHSLLATGLSGIDFARRARIPTWRIDRPMQQSSHTRLPHDQQLHYQTRMHSLKETQERMQGHHVRLDAPFSQSQRPCPPVLHVARHLHTHPCRPVSSHRTEDWRSRCCVLSHDQRGLCHSGICVQRGIQWQEVVVCERGAEGIQGVRMACANTGFVV